ncbi:hypothetical protein SHM_12810 [Spiroplasma ixodetis]|uniref:Spiroplasmavirus-related protein n=1 Tax=Spiroplasma ixodetis TaxID=2141 RepID=A0ABN6T247_9MOLU|nr:hypothetical protein SHM_12810 [Spiroplasma ixodetis]
MHKNYPSHVTKEQFENIKSTLENSKKKNKTKKFRFIWSVLCSFICIKIGCQWRMSNFLWYSKTSLLNKIISIHFLPFKNSFLL